MPKITILAELVDYLEDLGGYIIYVFKNLEPTDWTNRYIMCTRVPNWQSKFVKIHDVGYLMYQEVIAGKDKWYKNDKINYYNYSNIYFIEFIPKTDKPNSEDYTL